MLLHGNQILEVTGQNIVKSNNKITLIEVIEEEEEKKSQW